MFNFTVLSVFEGREAIYFIALGVIILVTWYWYKTRLDKINEINARIEANAQRHGEYLIIRKKGRQMLLAFLRIVVRALFLASIAVSIEIALFLAILPTGLFMIVQKLVFVWKDWRGAGYSTLLLCGMVAAAGAAVWFGSGLLRRLLTDTVVPIPLLLAFIAYSMLWEKPRVG